MPGPERPAARRDRGTSPRAARRAAPARSRPPAQAGPDEGPRASLPGGFPLGRVLRTLRAAAPGWNAPVVTFMAETGDDPFLVLAACILSLRTRDQTTAPASARLFARARTPAALARVPEAEVARLIYPVGFYRTKARSLRAIARALLDDHGGQVPASMDALLALPGVGRKTANLVLTQAFGLPGICVDVHVHRIPNRWGLVQTRTPEQSEAALREVVPERHWIDLNPTLVAFGQTICQPRSPRCSVCPVADACSRVGVGHSR